MAYADTNKVDYSTVAGAFNEKEFGHAFEYISEFNEWSGMPHLLFVGHGQTRQAEVKKTVAYVVVDEDDFGKPVIEKWFIKHGWARAERGAVADINV